MDVVGIRPYHFGDDVSRPHRTCNVGRCLMENFPLPMDSEMAKVAKPLGDGRLRLLVVDTHEMFPDLHDNIQESAYPILESGQNSLTDSK